MKLITNKIKLFYFTSIFFFVLYNRKNWFINHPYYLHCKKTINFYYCVFYRGKL